MNYYNPFLHIHFFVIGIKNILIRRYGIIKPIKTVISIEKIFVCTDITYCVLPIKLLSRDRTYTVQV